MMPPTNSQRNKSKFYVDCVLCNVKFELTSHFIFTPDCFCFETSISSQSAETPHSVFVCKDCAIKTPLKCQKCGKQITESIVLL
jgi:hypothetical protein